MSANFSQFTKSSQAVTKLTLICVNNELNLEKQDQLIYLDCSNQHLNRLILSKNLFGLNELKCSNNLLQTIENFSFQKNERLKFIDLSYNSIHSIENILLNITSSNLKIINLKSNQIIFIPSNIFKKDFVSLYEINLSWNKIHTIEQYAFQSPNLQILDLTANPIRHIETNSIFTSSLRLFFIVDDNQQLIERCKKLTSKDPLLLSFMNWYRYNGSLMRMNTKQFDHCFTHLDKIKTNQAIKHWKRLQGSTARFPHRGLRHHIV
mgnify:CR=1 FL=1